jgi:hypothetical protein
MTAAAEEVTMNDSDPPKPERRWPQVSLRTLLVVAVVLSVVSAWIGVRIENDRRIVAKLSESGSVEVGYEWGRVMWLSGSSVTDAELERLQGLTKLKTLYLRETKITDAGLEHLKGLTNLRWLELVNVEVTEEGVNKLQGALPNCTINRRSKRLTEAANRIRNAPGGE